MSLRTNTIYNVSGSLAPVAVALVTIPLLLDKIGEARFGVLALVWLLLGHFTVFDFGLSRATANRIAKLGQDDRLGRREIFWTSLWLNLGCGCLGAILLCLITEPLMLYVFEIGDAARREIADSIAWIACAVPLATVGGVLAGALDGRQRFDVANTVQAFGAITVQGAPVLAAYAISTELDVLIAASVLARALTTLLLFVANVRVVAPGVPALPVRRHARELFGYGAWISVSTFIMPFFVTLDKFVVGAVVGTTAVAYYSVPDQLVRRISVLPAALTRSVFPRMSALNESASREISSRAARLLISVITPAVTALIVVMHPFLSLWITPAFADQASDPGIFLAAGIWLNSLAMVPSAYLQATGRPDMTAKSHLIEILPHIAVLWLCVSLFGTVGAAIAILVVTILDAWLLMTFAGMRLWRLPYFRSGAAWVLAGSIIGLSGYRDEWWGVLSAFAVVCGSFAWSIRTSPELVSMTTDLLCSALRTVRRKT